MTNRRQQRKNDEKGQGILKELLADYGALNGFENEDYGNDYHFELFSSSGNQKSSTDEATGNQIYIQLKSTQCPRISGGLLLFSLKRKHVDYYLNKSNLPTFLIVVDVAKRQGYWLHIQQYILDRNIDLSGYGKKSEIAFEIPLADSLANIAAFIRAIETARENLLRDVARLDAYRLNQLNPNCNFSVDLIDGVRVIKPRNDNPLTIDINKAFEDRDKEKKDFLMGKKVTIHSDELPDYIPYKLPATPEGVKYKISMWSSQEFSAELTIETKGGDGSCAELLFYGEARKGQTGLYFRSTLSTGPLEIVVECDRYDKKKTCGLLNIGYNLFPWASHPSGPIPKFEEVWSFFKAVASDGSSFRIKLYGDLSSSTSYRKVEAELRDRAKFLFAVFDLVKKAKELCEKLGVEFSLPDLSKETRNQILIHHAIFVLGRKFGPSLRLDFPMRVPRDNSEVSVLGKHTVIVPGLPLSLIGERVCVRKHVLMTNVEHVTFEGKEAFRSTEQTTVKLLEDSDPLVQEVEKRR